MIEKGTKVVIGEVVPLKKFNEFVIVDPEQIDYEGQTVTIDTYHEFLEAYSIEEDSGNFLWHEEMFK